MYVENLWEVPVQLPLPAGDSCAKKRAENNYVTVSFEFSCPATPVLGTSPSRGARAAQDTAINTSLSPCPQRPRRDAPERPPAQNAPLAVTGGLVLFQKRKCFVY